MSEGRFLIRWKILLICVFFLSGCAVMKPRVQDAPPPDVRSILATLKMRYDLVDSMKTWMNVRIESDGEEEEIRDYLRYQKPDRLRVDVMGPFNEAKVVVLAVEKSFQIYFVTENELMIGEVSDEVIKDIFGVDLRVSDVRSSIFANPFLDGNISDLKVESYGDEWIIRRPAALTGYREEISILARNVTVTRWQIMDSEGTMVQEITFSRYQKVGGILRPLKAAIYRPADGTRISIESMDPEINLELAEMTFDLPVPDSTKIIQLSDLKDHKTSDSDIQPDS